MKGYPTMDYAGSTQELVALTQAVVPQAVGLEAYTSWSEEEGLFVFITAVLYPADATPPEEERSTSWEALKRVWQARGWDDPLTFLLQEEDLLEALTKKLAGAPYPPLTPLHLLATQDPEEPVELRFHLPQATPPEEA